MRILGFLLSALLPVVGHAQSVPLHVGNPVRIWVHCAGGAVDSSRVGVECRDLEGSLRQVTADSVVLMRHQERFALSVRGIDSISTRVRDGTQVGRGAVIGLAIGGRAESGLG